MTQIIIKRFFTLKSLTGGSRVQKLFSHNSFLKELIAL